MKYRSSEFAHLYHTQDAFLVPDSIREKIVLEELRDKGAFSNAKEHHPSDWALEFTTVQEAVAACEELADLTLE